MLRLQSSQLPPPLSTFVRNVHRSTGSLPRDEAVEQVLRWRAVRRVAEREDAEVRLHAPQPPGAPGQVTVIIPTYQRPQLVRNAVASVLEQSAGEPVALVVNDAGECPDLPPDPRVRVVNLTRNIGVAGAVRNVGIRLARTDFLAFLDDDNVWYPGHLEASLAALDEQRAQLSYTGYEVVNESGDTLHVESKPFDRGRLRHDNHIDTSTIALRREPSALFSRLPRRRGSRRIEDWEFVYRLSKRSRVAHVDRVTVRYVAHGGSYFSSR